MTDSQQIWLWQIKRLFFGLGSVVGGVYVLPKLGDRLVRDLTEEDLQNWVTWALAYRRKRAKPRAVTFSEVVPTMFDLVQIPELLGKLIGLYIPTIIAFARRIPTKLMVAIFSANTVVLAWSFMFMPGTLLHSLNAVAWFTLIPFAFWKRKKIP